MTTPLLEGHALSLQPLQQRHVPSLMAIGKDPSIWKFLPVRMQGESDLRNWMEQSLQLNSADRCQVWAICLVSGQVVGSSRLLDLDRDHRTAEIGSTWLAAPFRGSGVNPRAKLLQLTHAFETLRLRRVALKTHHGNLQSQAAMRKLGAVYEGTFRNHMLMPDGSTRHTAWYSIVAEEWPAVRDELLARIAAEPLPPFAATTRT